MMKKEIIVVYRDTSRNVSRIIVLISNRVIIAMLQNNIGWNDIAISNDIDISNDIAIRMVVVVMKIGLS